MWDFKDMLSNSYKLEGVLGPHAFVFKTESLPNSEQQTKINVTNYM